MEPSGRPFDSGDQPYVFTTVRWDPMLATSPENTRASCNRPCPFYMLEHHWTRLQVAKWSVCMARRSPAELLYNLQSGVQQWHASNPGEKPEALRIKLRVFANDKTSTEIMPVDRIPMSALFPKTFGSPPFHDQPIWTVTIDEMATEPSAATMYKTSNRACYERARQAAGITSFYLTKEVLLYTFDDDILDGSISTPYFWRKGRWVTPSSSTGGLQGTSRRWALEQGLCVEGTISKGDLRDGEIIYLSNASKGFFRARFVHRDTTGEG